MSTWIASNGLQFGEPNSASIPWQAFLYARRADERGRRQANEPFRWRWLSTTVDVLIPLKWRGIVRASNVLRSLRPGLGLVVGPNEIHEPIQIDDDASLLIMSLRPCNDGPVSSVHLTQPLLELDPSIIERFVELTPRGISGPVTPRAMEPLADLARHLSLRGFAKSEVRKRHSVAEEIRHGLGTLSQGRGEWLTLFASLGLDQFRAIRAFKQRYGVPPGTYLACLRLARARRSLELGQHPTEVALQHGFVDQSHLGRYFRRWIGVTPSYYLRASMAGRSAGLEFARAAL